METTSRVRMRKFEAASEPTRQPEPTRLLSCLLACFLIALLAPAGALAHSAAAPGPYDGETEQHCPAVGAASGACKEGFNLPVSFTVQGSRMINLRAMVFQQCEDGVAPRLAIIELPQSFRLHWEWGPRAGARMTFDSNPDSEGLERNGTIGSIHGGKANGYLSTLSKIAEDTYCFGVVQWRATSTSHPDQKFWPEAIPAEPVEVAPSPALLQTCITAMSAPPRVAAPLEMVHAGVWPNTGFPYEQEVVGALAYEDMPQACPSRYARTSHADIQMLKKGKWVTTRVWVASVGDDGFTTRISTYGGHPDIPARAPEYNTCQSGHRFHEVRIRVTSSLTRPALQEKEGSRQWFYPVKVEGSCAAATTSAERVHKLQHEIFGTPLSAVSRDFGG